MLIYKCAKGNFGHEVCAALVTQISGRFFGPPGIMHLNFLELDRIFHLRSVLIWNWILSLINKTVTLYKWKS